MITKRLGERRGSDRRLSDRRRQQDNRQAVIELCRSTLNLALVTRTADGDKLRTRTIRWRETAAALHTEQGVTELKQAFHTLFTEERLAGAKVRVALGGEFCVTRIVTGSTEEVRRELASLEERSHRYLTLGPGRKALSRSVQQLDARHQHAMLTVTNQRTLDLLMEIIGELGVQIETMEPSLISLTRAQNNSRGRCEDACILIQLDEDVAELGICHSGRLLLDYRPGGKTGPDNIASVVRTHLFRLQRYLNRYHNYLEKPLRQIYLTGDPEAVAKVRQSFANLSDVDVAVLEPGNLAAPWQQEGTAPPTPMAAALGMALGLFPGEGDEQGPNLIAGTLAQQRLPMRPVLVRSLAPLAAAVLIAVTLAGLHQWDLRQIAKLQAELLGLQPVRQRATALRLKLVAADEKLKQLHNLERKLPHEDWQRLLSRVSQSMPEDVWLDRLAIHDGQIATLGGASYNDVSVYDFVSYLKQVPDVTEIALEGTGVGQNETGPTTTFDLRATLANFAGDSDKGATNE